MARWSRGERKAYQSGKAYKLGLFGKKINFKNEKNRASFQAGYKSMDPSKYEDRKKK